MVGEQEDLVFIPQVSDTSIPKKDQEFESSTDSQTFYNNYARQAEFSTRVANNRKVNGEEVWKMFTCSKEGKTDETWQNKHKHVVARSGERNRGLTRCGCRARMTIKKSQDKNVWVVSYFVAENNHPLATPTKVHLLNSHRSVSGTKKALIQQFSEANIPTSQQVRLFEIDAGGPSQTGFLEKDVRNHKRDVEKLLFGHDAESLVQHFETEKQRNVNFYFTYETDASGVFVRYFWADCESRRSYEKFGDALVFDTTYNTNKYKMMFAPFVGVNHHRQTIVFGCGLLSDEKIESFVWLFSKFSECMEDYAPPGLIITDQDAAISRAILLVYPNVVHRFCLWHILNKFSEKINAQLYREHYHGLAHIIKESESIEEFGHSWMALMESTELKKNDWLSSLYTIRHRWVPAFFKGVFAAGMSSSQRAESNHSFFKRYVNDKNSLVDFIMRFNRALVHQRHDELAANHIDLNEKPRTCTSSVMEKQMVSIYTKSMFLRFQKKLQKSMTYICTRISSTDTLSTYIVKRFELEKIVHRERMLTYCTSSDFLSCSCRLFEFEGYPCRHMLCCMKVRQVMILPDKYILTRWTQKAKLSITLCEPSPEFAKGHSYISRHGALSLMAKELVDSCSLTEACSNFLMVELHKLKAKAKEFDNNDNTCNQMNGSSNIESTQRVQDPYHVRSKRCGNNSGPKKRLKSSKETASNRSCSVCSRSGHDKRTCPDLLQHISQPVGDVYYPEFFDNNAQKSHDNAWENHDAWEN